VFYAILPKQKVISDKIPIAIGVYAGKEWIEDVELTFVGPNE